MDSKMIESLSKRPDDKLLMMIEGLERRLAKKLDNAEAVAFLNLWQELAMMEAEKRGLNVN